MNPDLRHASPIVSSHRTGLDRAAGVLLAALVLSVAFVLPPKGALPIPEAVAATKLLALRWGVALAISVLAALALLEFWRGGARALPRRPALRHDAAAPLLLTCTVLFGLTLLSMVLCANPAHAFRESVPLLFPAALALCIGWAGLRPAPHATLAGVLLLGLVLSATVLMQAMGLNPYAWAYDFAMLRPQERGRFIATLGNPEFLGGFLAPLLAMWATAGVMLLPSLGAPKPPRTRRWAVFATVVGGAGLLLLGLLTTGTRSALLAVGVGIAFGLWSARRLPGALPIAGLWRAAVLTVGLVVVAVVLVPPVRESVRYLAQRSLQGINLQSPSVSERVLFNVVALRMALDAPLLGVGPGRFAAAFHPTLLAMEEQRPATGLKMLLLRTDEKGADNAHNDYLQFAAELGWPGLMAFLAMAAAIVGGRAGSPPTPSLIILQVGLVALLTSSLFSFPMRSPARAMLFWALVALLITELRRPASPHAGAPTERPHLHSTPA
jgi:O-antigen ligase